MSKTVLGNNSEKIIVFYSFKNERELQKFNTSMTELINGKVVQNTTFVIFVEDEKEKQHLPESVRFNYIAKNDSNFFGQLKNKELKAKMKEEFDVLFVFGAIEQQHVKRINKTQAKKRILTNTNENLNFDISLNANATGIEQIANFVQETLEKIQS